ncbi:unnamed protein product, partial [Prunus brigantina]
KKIWGGSFAGGETSAVETQNREKGGEASGIRNKKRKEKKITLNAVDYVQVRLWWICFSFSLLDVELDTLCGTNEEGTQFSNSFDVANESTMLLASEETDPKYLRDMVLSLIAAGKDTTASTLTWFIYMLCKDPHIQEKISQEVREAKNLKDNSSIDELSDNLTEEALEKMQYLLAVLNETTRLILNKFVDLNRRVQGVVWGKDFAYREALIFSAVLWGRCMFKLSDD